MKVFQIIGVALLVGLVVWIVAVFAFSIGRQTVPDVLGLGSGFEGNLQLPAQDIIATLNAARDKMFGINAFGGVLRLLGDIAGWLSFAATAAITLIVGSYGRAPAAGGAPADTTGLPARSIRRIGFLAALAAMLTAFGSLAVVNSQDYIKRADTLHTALVSARADVTAAKTPDEAQAVLDRITLLANQ